MPELPEVETVRADLAATVVGRRIDGVHISGRRTVRRHPAERVPEVLLGAEVTKARRHGKFLMLDLVTPNGLRTLAIHLRMSGQLLRVAHDAPLAPHTHARLALDDGWQLRFVDPRTFGEWWVTDPNVPELAHLGPDALNAPPDATELRALLRRRRTSLKAVLLDQRTLAGLGNIYADEVLWHARLRPSRPAALMTLPAARRLTDAIADVLDRAVKARGSTLSDKQYVDLDGQPGNAQLGHRVYARAGQECERCGRVIERIKLVGRSTFFCPRCQR